MQTIATSIQWMSLFWISICSHGERAAEQYAIRIRISY